MTCRGWICAGAALSEAKVTDAIGPIAIGKKLPPRSSADLGFITLFWIRAKHLTFKWLSGTTMWNLRIFKHPVFYFQNRFVRISHAGQFSAKQGGCKLDQLRRAANSFN